MWRKDTVNFHHLYNGDESRRKDDRRIGHHGLVLDGQLVRAFAVEQKSGWREDFFAVFEHARKALQGFPLWNLKTRDALLICNGQVGFDHLVWWSNDRKLHTFVGERRLVVRSEERREGKEWR